MIHHYTHPEADSISGEHWAVSTNGEGRVLIQLGDKHGEQVRITLTPDQAQEFADVLTVSIRLARTEKAP